MTGTSSPLQRACRDRIADELDSIRRFREGGGKTLGYLCCGFPEPVAAGLGLRPLRILHGASGQMEDAGGSLVRPDICPFIKVVLGGIFAGSEPFCLVDLWMGLATCDHTRRCFSRIAETAAVHTVQLPSTRTGKAGGYYGWQMTEFVRQAERLLDVVYSPDTVMEHAAARCAAGKVLAEAALGGSLSPMDLHCLFHLFHLSDPKGLDETLRSLLKLADEFSPRFMVALTGGALTLEDTHILHLLEEKRVGVLPLGCSGLQSVPFAGMNGLPVSASPEGLADESFRSLRCPRSRPNDETFDYIGEAVRISGCSGILVKTLKFCDLWFTERERLRERMDVPVLVIDTSYGEGEAPRQRNRVESFLETLRA
ncbi:MAG: 2-hydroxyacyl-CoA dehydratase [Candidatus Fermentibacteraceae bacterium]|nr:2-hydroxyacyl-CoA dehydratase [Candidatus Fermentibacteraceae bacterium]MBN2608399.1 2-hydroxyacyl-CoA dehydratase [Candidatus Fermentibacteraceae bacterium]